MEREKFLTDTCRAICAVGALVFIVGTSAALAQATADKSATKGSPAPAINQPSSMDKKGSMMPEKSGPAAGEGMRGSMMGMMKNMDSVKTTGDSDRDFATLMKMHHRGAIDMAQMELQSGKDAKMRAMARRIIEAQQKEIKQFDQWLAKRK